MPILILGLLLLTACTARAETPALRLATWNLEHLAEADGEGCRRRSGKDYADLRRYAKRMDADVIALQEVENEAAAARVFDPDIYAIEISHQRQRNLGTCRRQRGQRRTMLRTGFAIKRARLAELGLTYRRLPDFASIGMESQRRATRILIEPADGAGQPVQLLSLHLKAGCAYARLDGRVDRRQCRLLLRQRGILEEWIDARARADERFVLLGDFNRQLDQPNDHFWIDIDDGATCAWVPDPVRGRRCRPGTRQLDPDADLVLANAGKPFPFPKNPRYPYAIDHVVLDARTAERVLPDSYSVLGFEGDEPAPSDHHPVSISLRLGAFLSAAGSRGNETDTARD